MKAMQGQPEAQRVIKQIMLNSTYPCSTQLSMKLMLFTNAKIPKIVGILHIYEQHTIIGILTFLNSIRFHAQLSWDEKENF